LSVNILEKRKTEIESNLTEANKLREEILAEKKKFESEKEKIRGEFDQEIEKFQASILEKSRQLEQDNHKAREEIIQKALLEQKQLKENIFKVIQEDLLNSYSVILTKVLKDHASSENVSDSIKSSWESFKNKKL
jgi:F-type H+-transporting ATPase subunit b